VVDEGKEESVSLLNVMESASGLKSLRLSSGLGASYSFSKTLAMPDRYPFDVSDESFGIRAKKVGRAEKEEETERILKLRRERFMKGERGVASGSSINKPVQNPVSGSTIEISNAGGTTVITNTGASILSVGSTGTYYVYSFDGKLLAEYNGLGECLRDYIYLGDRLLAEYQPQTGQIYYYTSDQVNSTRVVTDQNGVRVFAATYDPYGGIQKIWENSYSPAMKFSGKERDTESNLDYFGARYYGNYYYRWLSPDPVVPLDVAYTNPQAWNLYSFNRNNPVNLVDPSGLYVFENGTQAQQNAFNKAIERAMGLPGLKEIISVFGSAGEENGVIIKIYDAKFGSFAPYVTSRMLQDLSYECIVHLAFDAGGDDLVIDVAHEGSHILDYKNYAGALREAFSKGDVYGGSVFGDDTIDLTEYAAEVKAYNFSITAAKGLGRSTLNRLGFEIIKSRRPNMLELDALLAKHYGISPSNPGNRLSNR